MKRSRTIISAVVTVAVLLTALGLGLCIRAVRSRRAGIESKAGTGSEMTGRVQKAGDANGLERIGAARGPIPARAGGERFRNLTSEEVARLREESEKIRARWENMSEEERQKFRTEMRERFSPRGRANE